MSLPIKTTIEDVTRVVNYLKNKPAGATVAEAKGVIDPRHLDGRKLKAYEMWGLIRESGSKIALTDEGRMLARHPEQAQQVYRGVIDRIRPYRSAVEWAHHQEFDVIELNDLAANWHDHHSDVLGTSNETSIKDAVACFFNLADGAGLGAYKLGRKGASTRLELNREAVRTYIEAGPSSPPWPGPELAAIDGGQGSDEDHSATEAAEPERPEPPLPAGLIESSPAGKVSEELRVFIAHGRNMRVVEQVQTLVELVDVAYEVAEEEETTAIPVPEKVLSAMRRCGAGVICVSVDESRKDGDGNYTVNENVLIEIGAAFVLYDQKVVLLWDRRLSVPSNLQGLYRCEFEGDEVGWDSGMRLMKAIRRFKST